MRARNTTKLKPSTQPIEDFLSGHCLSEVTAMVNQSALSKLEDKVVPRAEPSRPGRFARAIASVEAASRGRKSEPLVDRRSESRIGFPHEKTGPQEAIPDESSFYNPMNRDLRTVVETNAERASRISEAPSTEVADSESRIAEPSVPQSSIPETAGEMPSESSSGSVAEEDEPVTMAATAESVLSDNSGSARWTAVPVGWEQRTHHNDIRASSYRH